MKKKKMIAAVALMLWMGISGITVLATSCIKEISSVELKNVENGNEVYTYAIKKQYETTDKDQKIEFEEKKDGMKLDKVDYKIIETVPQAKTLEKTKDYKDLLVKDESKIAKSIEYKGNTYELKDVTWSEEPNIEHVSYTQDYGYAVSKPEHPATYEYTYTSPVTKKDNTVILPFARMEHSEYSWADGFTATVTFHNLDGEVFKLGSHEFNYNPDNPNFTQSDYTELVKMLGYDTSKYRLTSASWSGRPYKGKNGEMYRDATAYGQQYAASYKAVYEDDVENGKIYTAHATYTCEVELPEGEAPPTYIMQATAYYQKPTISVLVSVGLVVLVVLAIGILYVLSKKQKEK